MNCGRSYSRSTGVNSPTARAADPATQQALSRRAPDPYKFLPAGFLHRAQRKRMSHCSRTPRRDPQSTPPHPKRGRRMILAPGDHRILDELFEHRFLQSGQLSRLTGRSSQVIRRRLRRLAEQEFVMPLERRPAEQAAYSLGPEGFFFIATRLGVDVAELPFSRRICANKTQSPFIELHRGTESVSRRLRQKLEAYRIYNSRRLFDLQFRSVGMRVLFVLDCPTMRRADSLQAELRRYEKHDDPVARRLPSLVRIARLEDLEEDPLRAPVWLAGTSPEGGPLVRPQSVRTTSHLTGPTVQHSGQSPTGRLNRRDAGPSWLTHQHPVQPVATGLRREPNKDVCMAVDDYCSRDASSADRWRTTRGPTSRSTP